MNVRFSSGRVAPCPVSAPVAHGTVNGDGGANAVFAAPVVTVYLQRIVDSGALTRIVYQPVPLVTHDVLKLTPAVLVVVGHCVAAMYVAAALLSLLYCSSFVAISVNMARTSVSAFALRPSRRKYGTTIFARIAMIATTIINSMRVKPL